MNFKITTVKSFVFAGFLTIASDASAGINYLYNNVYSESFLSNSNKEEEASGKINELRKLIAKAKKSGINTLKEETALRTAEIFMGYAKWDENNIDANVKNFSLVKKYKNESEKYAKLLPDFERQEIIEMMNSSISELEAVMRGELKRLPVLGKTQF